MNEVSRAKLKDTNVVDPEHFVYEVVAYEPRDLSLEASFMGSDLAAGIRDLVEQWTEANAASFADDEELRDVIDEAMALV